MKPQIASLCSVKLDHVIPWVRFLGGAHRQHCVRHWKTDFSSKYFWILPSFNYSGSVVLLRSARLQNWAEEWSWGTFKSLRPLEVWVLGAVCCWAERGYIHFLHNFLHLLSMKRPCGWLCRGWFICGIENDNVRMTFLLNCLTCLTLVYLKTSSIVFHLMFK